LPGAKAAAAKLSRATIISIPGVGHAVSSQSPCTQAVVASFLADPAAPGHILRRCTEAIELHPGGLAVSRCATRQAKRAVDDFNKQGCFDV
jgi:hypothetical protein